MTMQCPRDKSELATREYEGVEIDGCGACGGIWLDKGELEQLQETPGVAQAADRGGREALSTRQVREDESRGEIRCPRCGGEMETREHGYASQVQVDSCIAGCGLWLDKGELSALERFYEDNRDNDTLPLHLSLWASLVGFVRR